MIQKAMYLMIPIGSMVVFFIMNLLAAHNVVRN